MNRLFLGPIIDVTDEAPAPVSPWAPLPGTVPILPEDRVSGQCRWTVHDAPPRMLYCGQPTLGHENYCPVHRALGTRPALPHRPRPDKLAQGFGKRGMILED